MDKLISYLGLSVIESEPIQINKLGLSAILDKFQVDYLGLSTDVERLKILYSGLSIEPDPNSYITIQVI